MSSSSSSIPKLHIKSRSPYPSYPPRVPVNDEKVSWDVEWEGYDPPDYTDPKILNKREADPADCSQIKDLGSRKTYENGGKLRFEKTSGRPLNPIGRTGIGGRGKLYFWGPNHAADPIVTRYTGGKLQVAAIKRKDTGTWALPGGMIDDGESPLQTAKREFMEEAMAAASDNSDSSESNRNKLSELLFNKENGKIIYTGYVDDPRNTDNSWIETCAVHFHCPESLNELIKLNSGSDATQVRWIDVDNEAIRGLHANHRLFVDKAVDTLRSNMK